MRLLGVLLGGILLFIAAPAYAHGGGLNRCGCHINHSTGECHCHQNNGCGCSCQPVTCGGFRGASLPSVEACSTWSAKEGDAENSRTGESAKSAKG